MPKFPKPRSRKAVRRAKHAHKVDVIGATYERVMMRDRACRSCGTIDRPEMHEIVWRSRLRGRPAEEVFNTRNCLRLCATCHAQVHAYRIALVPVVDELGADGRIEVQRVLPLKGGRS